MVRMHDFGRSEVGDTDASGGSTTYRKVLTSRSGNTLGLLGAYNYFLDEVIYKCVSALRLENITIL